GNRASLKLPGILPQRILKPDGAISTHAAIAAPPLLPSWQATELLVSSLNTATLAESCGSPVNATRDGRHPSFLSPPSTTRQARRTSQPRLAIRPPAPHEHFPPRTSQ